MKIDATYRRPLSPWIGRWLLAIAAMVFAMVVVGGATRLTGSGLSITEWDPIMGAIPPLSSADWQLAFEKYKLSSQYRLQNSGMPLSDFQFIFWWEWTHRVLGRAVGLAALMPLAAFLMGTGMKRNSTLVMLIAVPVLIGLQGALGWYMVASGLVDRVSVSQYRLAAHLTLAALIFAFTFWVYFSLNQRHRWLGSGAQILALGISVFVLVQIAAGGFVAGLDAGQGYNTWPLMDGALVPSGLLAAQPWWRNLFENALTVQFDHRMLAYLVFVLVTVQALIARQTSANVLLALVLLQVLLGISTLLLQVPLALALLHQAGALAVLAAAVWNLSRQTSIYPIA
jgi:cytochrome c oxidase assembly protein subunit 15